MKYSLNFSAILCLFVLVSCGNSSSTQTGPTATPVAQSSSNATQPQSPVAKIDPCSKFSAEDAQAITGVPMKLSPGHGDIVCMYFEASPQPGLDTARVSLMINEANSMDQENKEWQNTKEIRRLKAGEKNVTKLSGIGDEAWLEGQVVKGKVGLGGILARKGKSDFALQSAVMQPRSSLEKMKEMARKIAGQLQ
ncbi:MAG TPA: hypothetical protein VGJ33_07245 [Candidatus Angelobacter sp.]|jgi:hypothetical protein